MRAKISTTKVCIDNSVILNENEYNVHEIEFEFSEEYTNDLTKVALFTGKTDTYKMIITDNKCSIPPELLVEQGDIVLGVYAYKVENDELNIRYSPSPTSFFISKGSYIADENTENSEPLSPTDKEQIEQAITNLQNDVSELDTEKQDTLVSGENIKTLNSETLLGEGNIDLNDTYYTEQEIDTKISTINNAISNVENEIPSKISELTDDVGLVTTDVDDLEYYTKTSDLSSVALSGDFNDLSNKPDTSVYSLITETGSKINLEINSSTYELIAKLYDKNNNLINTSSSIDLPLETMVVGASYDSATKEIVLTLNNGTTIRVSVADLVSGLQTEITSSNKLASDLVDDTNSANKFVTSSEKTEWNNKLDSEDLADYVKNTDYATSGKAGLIRTYEPYGTRGDTATGRLSSATRTYAQYQTDVNSLFIGKGTLENVITGKDLTTKAYVDGLVGDIESILEELDVRRWY